MCDRHWGRGDPRWFEYQGCCGDLKVDAAMGCLEKSVGIVVEMILEACGVAVVAVVIG